ncbi:MAG: T9SS type A sorting domain-containing protein [Bacteroidetes bacterium]|nr:MAG: T9SS type A sorting domain-containing protein [Bacteroidota bacterium]
MKKLLFTLALLVGCFSLSLAQLPKGINHFQTYGGTWEYVDGNTYRFQGNHQNERVLYNFDLKTKSYTYLSDSLEKYQKRYYLNADTGYVVDNNGKNYFTYDSFATFNEVAQGYNFLKVMKTKNGFLAYRKISSQYQIYHSLDLQTWNNVTLTVSPGTTQFSVVEVDGNIYLINQANRYQVSRDGGATFDPINTGSPNSDYFVELIAFTDSNTIVARSSTNWLRTSDGGKNWSTTPFSFGYGVLYYKDLDTIYMSNGIGAKADSFFVSLDTLKTIQHYAAGMDSRIVGKRLTKRGDFLVMNQNQELLYSTNLFSGWESLPLFQNGRFCIDLNAGFGLAGGSGGNYTYSHDGGKTFKNSSVQGATDIMACKVVHDSLFFLSDRESDIYKSTDAGLTWKKVYNSTNSAIGRRFVHNADFSVIVLFRNSGGALISTNYGNSWVVLSGQMGILGSITPAGKILVAQEKYDNSTGSLVIKQTVEELASDGSRTLIKEFSESDLAQLGLQMFDDQVGYYFAAKKGTTDLQVFRTDDAWTTYTAIGVLSGAIQPMMIGYQLDYFIPGKDTIYVHLKHTSSGGTLSNRMIHYSYDGGATWTSEEIIPSRYNSPDKMTALYFFDSRHYISTWSAGRLYLNTSLSGDGKTPDGGGNGGGTSAKRLAQNSSLQVYPNPFSQTVQLQHESELLSVEIRDVTGKRVYQTALTGQKATLDLAILNAGVYYLTVQSAAGTETRKVIKAD